MGRDKALLMVDGVPLWQRQLALLRATNPAEVLISGPADAFSGAENYTLPDAWLETGPLGGIATALRKIRSELMLVLAVDLPRMRAEFLSRLVESATREQGVLAVQPDGTLEPLVAVYPRAAAQFAEEQLAAGQRKLARWIDRLETAGLITRISVAPEEMDFFANWNTPADAGLI